MFSVIIQTTRFVNDMIDIYHFLATTSFSSLAEVTVNRQCEIHVRGFETANEMAKETSTDVKSDEKKAVKKRNVIPTKVSVSKHNHVVDSDIACRYFHRLHIKYHHS